MESWTPECVPDCVRGRWTRSCAAIAYPSLLNRHSFGLVTHSSSPTNVAAEAKGTFLAFCLLASRSRLQTLEPNKFNGYQPDLSTIMWTPPGCSVDLNTLSAKSCKVKYVTKNNEFVHTWTFVCRACLYQNLARILEACGKSAWNLRTDRKTPNYWPVLSSSAWDSYDNLIVNSLRETIVYFSVKTKCSYIYESGVDLKQKSFILKPLTLTWVGPVYC